MQHLSTIESSVSHVNEGVLTRRQNFGFSSLAVAQKPLYGFTIDQPQQATLLMSIPGDSIPMM